MPKTINYLGILLFFLLEPEKWLPLLRKAAGA